jgi:hypothetical protein
MIHDVSYAIFVRDCESLLFALLFSGTNKLSLPSYHGVFTKEKKLFPS